MAIAVFVIYFGLLVIIGPIGAKKMQKKDSGDFILAGRSVPLWLVIGGIVATLVNTATLLGYGGSGYQVGIAAYFSAMGFMIALMWMGYWFIPRLRKANLTTIPELFSRFFGLKHSTVALILVMCRDMGVTAGASIGMAVVFTSVFDISLDMALLITLAVTLSFTVLGGMWAVLITDTIQSIIILVGTTILVPLAIAYIGGWTDFVDSIPSTHIDIFSPGASQTIAWFVSGFFTFIGYQTLIQRGLAADSEETAKKSFVYGGAISLVWYMIPFVVGILALIIFPDINPSDAFISVTQLFGTFGSLLFAVIIVSSALSTLSSTLLTTASNISYDVYKPYFRKNATEKELVLVTRISVVAVAIVGTLIGRSLPYILELLLTGGKIMAGSLAPVLLALVFWKAARKAYYSTILSMIAGALVVIVGTIIGSGAAGGTEGGVVFVWALDPILVALPVTLTILIIGTLIESRVREKRKPETVGNEIAK
jgi:SSS family solute:Na+ symporter